MSKITSRSEYFLFRPCDGYLGKPFFIYPMKSRYSFNYSHGILISVIRDISYHMAVMRPIERIQIV